MEGKKIAIVGHGSVGKAIKLVASNLMGSTTTFKNVETNEITANIPENSVFEILNSGPQSQPKSGRENRRERRKINRKKK